VLNKDVFLKDIYDNDNDNDNDYFLKYFLFKNILKIFLFYFLKIIFNINISDLKILKK